MADQLSLAPGWSGAGVKHPPLWWIPLGGGDRLAALPRAVEENRGCAVAVGSGVGCAAGAGCLVAVTGDECGRSQPCRAHACAQCCLCLLP